MSRIFLIALAGAGLGFGAAPAWDSTGDGLLTGTYNFRQVTYVSDGSGNINRELVYFGNINFDGKGGYTLPGSNTLNNTGGALAIPATGTYSVAGSGYGFLSDPLAIGQSVYFLVSKGVLLGSSTENPGANGSYNNDLFIATPLTTTFTTASFNGAYTFTRFLPGGDASFTMNPDGAGHIATVSNSGYTLDGGRFSGASYNVTYTVSGGAVVVNNGGTFSVGSTGGLYLVSPEFETLYMSPDTNFIFGGSPTGNDIFIGVRNTASATTLTSGLYYEIGVDEDASQYRATGTARIDSYYGVFNALPIINNPLTGAAYGATIGHERLLYAGSPPEGVTYTTTYPAGSYNGPANVSPLNPSATTQYTVGANGIRLGLGIGPWLGIEVALPVPAPPQTLSGSVYIDPTGIVNTASSAPFTAGISPGEFVSLYNGVNTGSSTSCATGAPFPPILSGIQVLVNGVAAPVYCVGSGNTPVTFIVPDAVSQYPIATIQIMNGSTLSNTVTAFVYKATPGVLTFSPVGGIGYAAAEHGDYSLVTPANPARPGETIAVYLTGFGSLVPVSAIAVDVAGIPSPSIPYAGLNVDPGVYQINFQVPATAPGGNDPLAITGPDSWTSESLLPVAVKTQFAAVTTREPIGNETQLQ